VANVGRVAVQVFQAWCHVWLHVQVNGILDLDLVCSNMFVADWGVDGEEMCCTSGVC